MMRVMGGTPFTVPQGKLFVVTGLGSTTTLSVLTELSVSVEFDGVPVVSALIIAGDGNNLTGGGPAIPSVPPGIVANEGTVVSVSMNFVDPGVVLGYLADA